MLKTARVLVLMAVLIIAVPCSACAESTPIYIDNELLVTEVPATIIEGHTLAPMRAVFEALGATVAWDDSTKTVTGQTSDTTITLALNSTTAYINGKPTELAIAAQSIDGHVLVPLRFISESLGATANYDDAAKSIIINTAASNNAVAIADEGNEAAAVPSFEQVVAQGNQIRELSFKLYVTKDGQKKWRQYYLRNDECRAEWVGSQGTTLVNIFNKASNTGYQFDLSAKLASELTAAEVAGYTILNPKFLMEDADLASGKYAGQETFDGRPAYVFNYVEVASDGKRVNAKGWFSVENGVPLKIEYPDEEPALVTEFMDLSVKTLDDSLFELPADVAIVPRADA